MASSFQFKQNSDLPVIIAGPCTAESEELVTAVSTAMHKLSQELKFQYVFKASFDKANRTSSTSFRGQGLPTTLKWFSS